MTAQLLWLLLKPSFSPATSVASAFPGADSWLSLLPNQDPTLTHHSREVLVTPAEHPLARTPAAPGCSPRHSPPFAVGMEVRCDEEALHFQAWDSTLCPPAPDIRCIYIHTHLIAGRREMATFQAEACPRLVTLNSALMKPCILACTKLATLLWKKALEKY